MPISREAERAYPGGSLRSPEWLAIRRAILGRAGRFCECRGECGIDHRDERADEALAFSPAIELAIEPQRCWAMHGDAHPVTGSRVVLTIAHLDQDPANNTPDNLRALCQRCHNRLDAPHRRAHAAETRRRRLACGDLFDGPYDAQGAP